MPHTTSVPERSAVQNLSLAGAVLFGAAPVAFGLFRWASTGWDLRMLWMALVATIFAAGVLVSAIGKRRSRHMALFQSAVIVVVGAALAAGTGYLLGATSGPGSWMVGLTLGLCLGVCSELITFARPTHG